jgi:hypothetical protein
MVVGLEMAKLGGLFGWNHSYSTSSNILERIVWSLSKIKSRLDKKLPVISPYFANPGIGSKSMSEKGGD